MFWIDGIALAGAIGAIGTLLFAGVLWLQVAKERQSSSNFQGAAKLTGVGLVVGSLALLVLLGSRLGSPDYSLIARLNHSVCADRFNSPSTALTFLR